MSILPIFWSPWLHPLLCLGQRVELFVRWEFIAVLGNSEPQVVLVFAAAAGFPSAGGFRGSVCCCPLRSAGEPTDIGPHAYSGVHVASSLFSNLYKMFCVNRED